MTARTLAPPFALLVASLAWSCAGAGADPSPVPRPPSPAPSLVDSSPAGVPQDDDAVDAAGSDGSDGTGDVAPSVQEEAATTPADEDPGSETLDALGPLGWVAGSQITAEDLLVEWHTIAARDVWLILEKLVTTKLAFAEAQRLGLRLEPEAVQLRVAEETRRLAQTVADSGEGLSVEEYVRARLGVKPDTYFARMRVAAIRQMIAERVVRASTLENDSARVRVIVVSSEEEMQAVQSDLALGQEFADVARARSQDDTAGEGGLLPFFLRAEGSPLSVAAFAASPGETVGPLELSDRLVLLAIEAFRAPETVTWDTHEEALEKSLAEHPIRDGEFLAWKLAMEERYPIDLRRLEDLLGLDE